MYMDICMQFLKLQIIGITFLFGVMLVDTIKEFLKGN